MITQNLTNKRPISDKRMRSILYHHREELVITLAKGMDECLQKEQALGITGVSLHLTYLRSAALLNRPYFRIDLMDEQQYNGNWDCFVCWQMPGIMQYAQAAYPSAAKGYGNNPGYEVTCERLRASYAEQLYVELRSMIQSILNDALNKCICPVDVPIYFGEYMQPPHCLYRPAARKEGGRYAER